jgi:hypothetical protein
MITATWLLFAFKGSTHVSKVLLCLVCFSYQARICKANVAYSLEKLDLKSIHKVLNPQKNMDVTCFWFCDNSHYERTELKTVLFLQS